MARILLAHSYFLRFDAKARKQMQPCPPLGTLLAAAVLREAGHEVALFDPMFADGERDIVPHLDAFRPGILLFFEDNFHYLSKMCLSRMREALFAMAAEAKRRGCLVVAQGSDPVDHLPEYFSRGVDIAIIGEGEQTAVELFAALGSASAHTPFNARGSAALDAITGIAYADVDGPPRITPKRALLRDLDALPFAAWDLADIPRYREAWIRRHGFFSLNVATTRGCPYHCNWCAKPVYGQAYTSRSPENVAEELLLLKRAYAPDRIWFTDDILGLKPGWLARFADVVADKDCRIPFSCQTRADLLLREDNARHMARAGAHTVWLGAESGSQSVLDAMDKGATVAQIRDATRLLRGAGVRVAWFLQFGYLGETWSDVRATLRLLREEAPDDIGVSVSYPLPGTAFYDTVRDRLGDKRNWSDSGDLDLMFPGTFRPAFYRALHAAVHKEFRLRQALRALRRRDFSPPALRRIALVPWNIAQLCAARIGTLALRIAGAPRGRVAPLRTEA
ncbi:MAG: B12-binding domain-containing radical SAM protein [Ignavibacteria bacterium]|nr:B12-binding domain-containing radical SAM protein [Ignavibacteria bacterium]